MLKNISFLAAMLLAIPACILVDTTDDGNDEVGDGDGDPTTTGDGDGDGDPTGDGDGDGDQTGDGDGDQTGDGDGEPAAACGWFEDPTQPGYYCGGEGEDPSGTNSSACPAGLVEGDACDVSGLTGAGCCDADGNNWYCAEDAEGNQLVVFEACGA